MVTSKVKLDFGLQGGARRLTSERGFTFVELVLVILLISVLGTMGVGLVGENFDWQRYEETRERVELIKQAILGTTALDGHKRTDFGYVGDWGLLPASLSDLTTDPGTPWTYNTTYGFGAGWKGPQQNR